MNQTKSLISKVFALSALALSLAFVPIGHDLITSPIEEATYAWTGAQTPSVADSYYSQANDLTGSALKSKLYTFNKPTNTSYSWSRYEAADEAYNDSSSVISIYTRHNILKSAHVGSSYSWTTWNREHIYTQTAFPNSDEDNHNIFACEGQINGYRSNLKFGEVAHNSTNQVTVFGHITDNYKTASLWEPCDEAKGEVARAVLYTSLYYNYTISSIFSSEAVCLKWHAQFPVTEREIFRNNKVYTLQGNRNPFVDHPSYANSIYNPSTPYTEADPLGGGTPVTAPNTITLSPSTPTIAVSQSVTLNVTVDTGSSSVTWASNNNSIATVSNGVVTGVTAGTATITATSTLDNTIKGTATVIVKALSSLNYSGTPNTTTYSSGQSFNPAGLTVTATYSDSSTANVTSSVSWTPSPLTAGTTSVTGSYGGKTITVSGLTVTSNKTMIINKTNSGLPTTKTTSEMTKSYTVKNGANNDGTMSIRWGAGVYNTAQYDEFALPNGVKIQPGDTTYVKSIKADLYGYINSDVYANGVKVTGVEGEPSANGNSKMLTYTINSNNWYIIGNTAAHDQCFYSIEFSIGEGSSPINRSVTGVSLNKNTLTLETGKSETLSATVNPTDATNKNVTWSSNNTSVATVNSSGAVSALAAGNATITVTTVDGSFTANCAVTVQPASLETVYVTSVELNKNSLSLEAEKNETLTVTINPTNATNKNVTWSSNKPAFVSVSSTGVVTAIEVGVAIITVTTEDGSFTDTCEVTVTAKTITPNGNGGCGGSIAITSGLIAALSAVGIVAILIKKKKYFIK